jgi:hypothetical protein
VNNSNDESIDTVINDNDDEGFINMNFDKNESNMMPDYTKQCDKVLTNEQTISTTPKSIYNKPSHFPYSTQNPYDDDGSLFVYSYLLLLHSLLLIDILISEQPLYNTFTRYIRNRTTKTIIKISLKKICRASNVFLVKEYPQM